MAEGNCNRKSRNRCPEGKENWSGGSTFAQQFGVIRSTPATASAQGRFRPHTRFILRNSATPDPAESTAAGKARKRSSPPNAATASPTAYHRDPSPPRVAAVIHRRIQRGARHRFTRCIKRMSRESTHWSACQKLLGANDGIVILTFYKMKMGFTLK